MELLVKYLFTSEKLSIQIRPDDAAARKVDHRRGKEEAWVVLGAEPDATIGIGLRHTVSKDRLRATALDGSIEELVDWRPATAGDFYYANVHNHFNSERHLVDRSTFKQRRSAALAEWQALFS